MGDIIPKEHASLTTPGIGMSGLVMCPFFKGACLKSGCELWVELVTTTSVVARCSLAWISVLSTEIRSAIEKVSKEPLKEVV
jgi:hypothetical protein